MDDLKHRLRDASFIAFDDGGNDYTTAQDALSAIEALEARIAKADALADILQSAINEHDTADYPPDAENPWTMQEWFSDEDRAALAAYREGSDT